MYGLKIVAFWTLTDHGIIRYLKKGKLRAGCLVKASMLAVYLDSGSVVTVGLSGYLQNTILRRGRDDLNRDTTFA